MFLLFPTRETPTAFPGMGTACRKRAMSTISDAWFHRIKSATRDLVTRCGGVVRAGDIAKVSKTEVSRWQTSTDPTIVPLTAVLALEADCGVALVTAVMADLNGRRVVDDGGEGGDATAIVARHAEMMRSMAEVVATSASAFADGRVTPAEAELLDRAASDLARRIDVWRADIAAAKGPRLVSGGA